MGWGSTGRAGICSACVNWLPRGRRDGACRRCGRTCRLNTDDLCRPCLLEIRSNDLDWVVAELQGRTSTPRGLQLALLLDIPLVAGHPMRGQGPPRRRQAGTLPTWLRHRLPQPPGDDVRVCPPQTSGQLVLLRARRSFTLADPQRIRDRVLPGFAEVEQRIRAIRDERGLSRSWCSLTVNMARLALAGRDPDERQVREEDLDQIPTQRRHLKEALRAVGLLRLRIEPPGPFHARYPFRSCEHCLAWSGHGRRFCTPCLVWNRIYRNQVSTCGRCQRTLPLKDGQCRFCLLVLAEDLLGEGPVEQLWFGGAGFAPVLNTRLGPKRFNGTRKASAQARANAQRRAARRVSDHLVDPGQLLLIDDLRRDWDRVRRSPLPALTEQAQHLIDEFDELGRVGGWVTGTRERNLRTLRLALAWLGAAAPLREVDIGAIAAANGFEGKRAAQFLDAKGLLISAARVDPDQAGVERIVATLPPHFIPEVTAWITVLRGQGRRTAPAKDWAVIRQYLGYMAPVLRDWGQQIDSLRAISSDDIQAQFKTHNGSIHSLHTALRSLFRALRRQRLIFRDPTRNISLTHPERLPVSLPSDRLRGLIDNAEGSAAKLVVALLAIHALHCTEVIHLKLDDINRSTGRMIIRRRGGRLHTVILDELTLGLIATWIRERSKRWPISTNPHLLVSQVTATDNRRPPVTKYFIWKATTQLGFNPTQLRADRILNEALHTEDPVHLMQVFGCSAATAMKYLHAAHPARFIDDPTAP
jgi:integrase